MHSLARLAVIAALVAGSPFAAMAQGASTDNYGSVISSMQAGKGADLSTFTSSSTVNCVKISSLKGDASGDATALDNALSKNAEQVTTLKSSITANADLKSKLDAASCPLDKVVSVTSGTDGAFNVYVDDRT